MIKMVRASAPALDRLYRRLKDVDVPSDSVRVQFLDQSVRIEIAPKHFDLVAEGVIHEFHVDGWGFHTEYADNDAVKGVRTALIMDHPITLTKIGNQVKNRPAQVRLEIPMPYSSVPLDGAVITQMANEAADVVRDLLTQQAVKENPSSVVRPVPLWAKPLLVELDDDEGAVISL